MTPSSSPKLSSPPTDELAKLAELREPFDAKHVGKLPKVTCKACSDRNQTCQSHKPARCQVCNAYVSPAHVHIDFVGHAEVTNRLLNVDPLWSWEPFSIDPDTGLPKIVPSITGREFVLWIRLTVCGLTRPGVGTVAKDAFDAEKQLIGDALRNASMRYGVALQLWSKNELEAAGVGEAEPADQPKAPQTAQEPRQAPRQPQQAQGRTTDLTPFAKAVLTAGERAKVPDDLLASFIEEVTGSPSPASITRDKASQITDLIYDWEKTAKAS